MARRDRRRRSLTWSTRAAARGGGGALSPSRTATAAAARSHHGVSLAAKRARWRRRCVVCERKGAELIATARTPSPPTAVIPPDGAIDAELPCYPDGGAVAKVVNARGTKRRRSGRVRGRSPVFWARARHRIYSCFYIYHYVVLSNSRPTKSRVKLRSLTIARRARRLQVAPSPLFARHARVYDVHYLLRPQATEPVRREQPSCRHDAISPVQQARHARRVHRQRPRRECGTHIRGPRTTQAVTRSPRHRRPTTRTTQRR